MGMGMGMGMGMSIKKTVINNIKILMAVLAIAVISPFILAKLEFWGPTQAATPQFQPPHEQIHYPAPVHSYAEAVERASGAVVSIQSIKEISMEMNPLMRDPFFRQFFGDLRGQMPQHSPPSIGSGVIVTKDGYILTNNHVVREADEINIKLSDGRTAEAKLVGSDPESDLAILKIDLPDLPVIALGDSAPIRVGDVVLAIGNPFGVGQTVTQGIVSATQRQGLGINTFENFIQTDADINPGNSGGALIDVNGNLIGINNAIFTRSGGSHGIGFAIPVSLAKEVMQELIDFGHVTRGWLGITVAPLNDEFRKDLDYPKGEGAVISGIQRGGPAHKAGLLPGDIIISINQQDTKDPSGVLGVTSKLKPDAAYPISVIRNGETHDFRVMIGKRPVKLTKPTAESKNPRDQGDFREPREHREHKNHREHQEGAN